MPFNDVTKTSPRFTFFFGKLQPRKQSRDDPDDDLYLKILNYKSQIYSQECDKLCDDSAKREDTAHIPSRTYHHRLSRVTYVIIAPSTGFPHEAFSFLQFKNFNFTITKIKDKSEIWNIYKHVFIHADH